jgi:hypothetical protein
MCFPEQRFLKPPTSLMCLRFRATDRAFQQSGYFAMLEANHVVQQEEFSMARR